MSWLDGYRTASFRGAEFHVEAHDAEFGRRTVVHEFPGRDQPGNEDLGRMARAFTVEGYVVGDDYARRRDGLIEACEAEGPGQLVHPYLGELTVQCTSLKVRETSGEGRMCRLAMTFEEAGETVFPSSSRSPIQSVRGASSNLLDAARSGFLDTFRASGMASFVQDAAADLVRGVSAYFDGLGVNPIAGVQEAADFAASLRELADDVVSLLSIPEQLADRLLGVIEVVPEIYGENSQTVLDGLSNAYAADYAGTTATPSRKQQAANQSAVGALIRQAVIAGRAQDAVIRSEAGEFPTRTEVLTVRDAITDAIDAEAERLTTTDDQYRALVKLRAEVVQSIPSPSMSLPDLVEVTPQVTVPSLVLAYRLYADAGRADDIAARNNITHPGFLPGGLTLEVVTDA